jgi:hypothetical protein
MAQQPTNHNDTTPAAPTNFQNINWQGDAPGSPSTVRNISANVPKLTASGTGHQAGLAPDPGASAGTVKFLCEDATYKVNALVNDSDVSLTSPADADVITYEASSSLWKNKPAASASGPTVNDQTASYTAVLGDANNVVTMSNASANNFTVPPNSSVAFAIGTTLTVVQKGAGQTAFVAGAGVTINNPSTLTARAQWSMISVTKILTDTWVAAGDLT